MFVTVHNNFWKTQNCDKQWNMYCCYLSCHWDCISYGATHCMESFTLLGWVMLCNMSSLIRYTNLSVNTGIVCCQINVVILFVPQSSFLIPVLNYTITDSAIRRWGYNILSKWRSPVLPATHANTPNTSIYMSHSTSAPKVGVRYDLNT